MKKITFITFVLVCMILAVSCVNAADDDINTLTSNNISDVAILTDTNVNENLNLANEDILSEEDDGSFAALSDKIHGASENSVIELTHDYVWADTDQMTNGTVISIKNLTIDGKNHIIDAKGHDRIFVLDADNIVLKNIVFINGKATKENVGQGGAILWDGNFGTMINCTFINNTAVSDTFNRGSAGAVLWSGSYGTLTNSTFIANSGDGHTEGGAVVWDSYRGTIENTKFINNTHTNLGGALYIAEDGDYTNVMNCTFINNFANRFGGAIGLHHRDYVRLSKNTFINNTATYAGGAIYYVYYIQGDNIFDVIDCTFIGNVANGNPQIAEVSGGGAICTYKNGTIVNCTFIDNSAPYSSGGAVYWVLGSVNITQSTFINNSAAEGKYSAIDMDNGIIKNCIILSSDDEYIAFMTTNVTADYNWWGSTADNCNVKPSKVLGLNVNKWYYLDVLPNNLDGYALITLNNVYDYQTKTNYTYDECELPDFTFDLTGQNLTVSSDKITLRNGEAYLEFGNIKYPATITVKKDNVIYTKVITFGDFDLLQMLIDEASENSVVVLPRDYTYTIGMDSIESGVEIYKNLIIDGNGHTIDAKSFSRIFKIYDAAKVTFKNINFINGLSQLGSAIYYLAYDLDGTDFVIDNCTFSNNIAEPGDVNSHDLYGGGAVCIYTGNGSYTIKNSKFTDNMALNKSYGGAIYVNGLYSGKSYFNASDNIFDGNSAHLGAAVMLYTRNTENHIDKSIFVNNNAPEDSVVTFYSIYDAGSSISNSVFLNNNAEFLLNDYMGTVVANNNWWGSTAENYTVKLSTEGLDHYDPRDKTVVQLVQGAILDNWLFLNATSDPSEVILNQTSTVKFFIQSYNPQTGEVSDYDNAKLPEIVFALDSIRGDVFQNNATFEEEFQFRSNPVVYGNATVTVKYQGFEYTLIIPSKIKSEIVVPNDTVTLYVHEYVTRYSLADLIGAVLVYESNDTDVVNISGIIIQPNNEGTAKIHVTYAGDNYHTSASADVTVIVKKIPTYLTLNETDFNLEIGKSINIGINISLPDDAPSYEKPYVNLVQYNNSASNPIIEISRDGTVKALSSGKVTIQVSFPGTFQFLPSNATFTVTIDKLPTSINLNSNKTLSLFVDDISNIDAALNVTGLPVSQRALTYVSSDESVAKVDKNGKITAVGNGTAVITMTWNGNNVYDSSSETVEVTVKKYETSIDVNDTIVIDVTDSNKNIDAVLNPSQAGDLTYSSSDESVVTVNDEGILTVVGGGFADIAISYDGNYKYEKSSKTVRVIVNKLGCEITSDTPEILVIGDETDLNAALSPDVGELIYESSDESVVTVDETGKITAVGSGSAVVTIKFEGNAKYEAKSKTVNVLVKKLPTVIDVKDTSLKIGDVVNLNATLNHEGDLEYSSSNTIIATVDGDGTVTILEGGIAEITVSFAETDKYEGATKTVKVSVTRLPQEIDDEQITLTVFDEFSLENLIEAADGAQFEYSLNDTGIVSIDDATGVVTALTGGCVNVTIKFGATDKYEAGSVNVTIVVKKLPTDITVNVENLELEVGEDAGVFADVSSTNPNHKPDAGDLVWEVQNSDVADFDDGKITALGEGATEIVVSFKETPQYEASSKTITVNVNKISTSISVADDAFNLFVGDVDYIGAVLSPVGAGDLIYDVSNPSVVSVDSKTGKITALSKGSATVTVRFAETDKYAQSSKTVTVNVDKITTSISVNDTITLDATDSVNIGALLNISDDYTLNYQSQDPSVVTIDSNGIITAVSGGETKIKVTFDETDKYYSTEALVTVTVNKVSGEIVLSGDEISLVVDGEENINAQVTPAEAELIYESSDESVVTVDETGKITAVGEGSATVTVKVKDEGKFSVTDKTLNVVVKRIETSIDVNDTISIDPTAQNVDINAKLNISDDYELTYEVQDTSVVKAENGLISAVNGGATTLTVRYAGNDKYLPATATVNVVVEKIPTEIEADSEIELIIDQSTTVSPKVSPIEGEVTYEIEDSSIIKIDDDGTITALKAGETNLIIRFAGDEKYSSSEITVPVKVLKKDLDLTQSEITLTVNDEFDLKTILGYDGDIGISYYIQNPNMISIDENAIVTALGQDINNYTYIIIQFSGNDRYNKINPLKNSIKVYVKKLPSKITVNATININVDDEINIDAILNHEGDLIYVSFNESATIDENGNIKGICVGSSLIAVSYPQTEKYLTDIKYVTVNVAQAQTSIDVAADMSLNVGQTSDIGAELSHPSAGELTYQSSDTSVVTVDENGAVTAVGKGSAKITVTFTGDENYSSSVAEVTVNVDKTETSIDVADSLDLKVGANADLKASLNPEEAGALSYESSDVSVVTVDADGKVTAVGKGTATVTVKYGENDKYYGSQAKVTVNVDKTATSISVASDMELNTGESIALGAVISPADAGDMTYTSSDSSVVSVDSTGKITAKGEGTATITVKFAENDKYYGSEAKVNVKAGKISTQITVTDKLSLTVGDTSNLNAVMTPAAGDLTYTSSDVSVVTVDANGKVTAVGKGTATITVKFAENDKYQQSTKTVQVTVSKDANQNTTVGVKVAHDTGIATVTVNTPADATGNVVVTVNGKEYNAKVSNGKATVTIDDLKTGDYTANVVYSGDSKYDEVTKDVNVHIPNIKIDKNKNINMFYYDGTQYVAHLTSDTKALAGKTIEFKIAGKTYKKTTDKYGYAYLKINLAPKTYTVTAQYLNVKVTNKITVKHVITAKNLSVKKSASSLKIKVTLKNKKVIKNKKVTLKFKGKTYSAKTNKKGVATFTISKSVLKKLTAGKKYAYKVTYVKSTLTKYVTVKK